MRWQVPEAVRDGVLVEGGAPPKQWVGYWLPEYRAAASPLNAPSPPTTTQLPPASRFIHPPPLHDPDYVRSDYARADYARCEQSPNHAQPLAVDCPASSPACQHAFAGDSTPMMSARDAAFLAELEGGISSGVGHGLGGHMSHRMGSDIRRSGMGIGMASGMGHGVGGQGARHNGVGGGVVIGHMGPHGGGSGMSYAETPCADRLEGHAERFERVMDYGHGDGVGYNARGADYGAYFDRGREGCRTGGGAGVLQDDGRNRYHDGTGGGAAYGGSGGGAYLAGYAGNDRPSGYLRGGEEDMDDMGRPHCVGSFGSGRRGIGDSYRLTPMARSSSWSRRCDGGSGQTDPAHARRNDAFHKPATPSSLSARDAQFLAELEGMM